VGDRERSWLLLVLPAEREEEEIKRKGGHKKGKKGLVSCLS